MSGVLWGLAGAVFIGGSDCVARVTSQRLAPTVLVFWVMAFSTAALTLGLSISGHWPPWHVWGWVSSAVSGVLNVVALVLLYKALARGPVAVASTAASTFTVLLVLINIAAGAAWSWLQIIATAIVFLGISQLARKSSEPGVDDHYSAQWLRTTALLGLGTAAAVSLRMFLAQESGDALGSVEALYLNRVFATLAAAIVVFWPVFLPSLRSATAAGSAIVIRDYRLALLVLFQAALETAALGVFLAGSGDDGRIGAAIGFSAFAATTALFARVFLGEKIGWRRSLWIGIVLLGLSLAIVGAK